jgi:uncharacterized protein YbcI
LIESTERNQVMKSKKYKLIHKARGEMDAQMIKNFLLSKGIDSIMYGESIGKLYGLTNTSLGEVEIYVKNEDAEKALSALQDII